MTASRSPARLASCRTTSPSSAMAATSTSLPRSTSLSVTSRFACPAVFRPHTMFLACTVPDEEVPQEAVAARLHPRRRPQQDHLLPALLQLPQRGTLALFSLLVLTKCCWLRRRRTRRRLPPPPSKRARLAENFGLLRLVAGKTDKQKNLCDLRLVLRRVRVARDSFADSHASKTRRSPNSLFVILQLRAGEARSNSRERASLIMCTSDRAQSTSQCARRT